jgi:hypothetical protein
MNVPVPDELRRIAAAIVAESKTFAQWAEIESCDMFQDGGVVGGFDATEGEFTFSYFRPDGEIWFQLSIEQLKLIASGQVPEIEGERRV